MSGQITLGTSLRDDEVQVIDQIVENLHAPDRLAETGKRYASRSGVMRSMLRFALENLDDYSAWMEREEGRPE